MNGGKINRTVTAGARPPRRGNLRTRHGSQTRGRYGVSKTVRRFENGPAVLVASRTVLLRRGEPRLLPCPTDDLQGNFTLISGTCEIFSGSKMSKFTRLRMRPASAGG